VTDLLTRPLSEVVARDADGWDRAGAIPEAVIRELAGTGGLCPQVPAEYGGAGLSSTAAGEYTASLGELCTSLRSLATSQGMAAWAVQRFGSPDQRATFLPRLTGGALAAVGFSEADAGSDLAAMRCTAEVDGDTVVLTGEKVWVTGAAYADLVVVFARHRAGAAAVVVPTDTPGVRVTRTEHPLGCRAAGHATVRLDGVRLPVDHLLHGAGQPLGWLITAVLTYGRISVAWGCVGILRACLTAATRHARTRGQFGKPIAEHQLVARHLAELFLAEQVATRMCEHASRAWDLGAPELHVVAVAAKQIAARNATEAAATAVQVLASAGAVDGTPVARAYRDAKLMEIIEGSTEISQLLLAQHALAVIA
jgi:methoxymalonate biosynthesis protein